MQEDVKLDVESEQDQEIEIEDINEPKSNEVVVNAKDEDQDGSTNDSDLSEYSDSVKKRISKLTNRFREEERQRQAAVEYAEGVKTK
jgi:hypothetical protein